MERFRFPEATLQEMERMAIPFAVYQFIDRRIVTLILSDGFCSLFGYDDKKAAYSDMDRNMYRYTHPDDVMRISDAALKFALNKSDYNVIYRSRKPNDSKYSIIHATGRHVYMNGGERIAYVWYTDEGTYEEGDDAPESGLRLSLQKSLHEESILKASYYDYLTGMPSISYFFDLANAGKEAMYAKGIRPVMLFFDINGMKYYNDKHGFAAGDKLIRSLANLLTDYFGSERCSRFGSDRFAVFSEDDGIETKLYKLFSEWNGTSPENPPVRIGIYRDCFGDVHAGTACDRAKMACDAIKNIRSSAFNYFSEDLLNSLKSRQYIIENLDTAMENGWIKVYYQPIVRAVSGKVCDEEALSRWIDPVKGIMSPSDFIPTLEEAGLVYKLDLYVIDRVLEKLKAQREKGLFVVPQSVNLSRSDFDCCDIVEEIRRRVDDAGISRELITIELTESMIGSDFEFIKKQMSRFQSLGFSVWIDDFGSGYSSLDVLQNINFQLIKFDMSFMHQFSSGNSGKIILTELMRMANALGMDTLCEGVETEEQIAFLREIGCSKLQGFYYCKPIPLDQIFERYEKGMQIGFENPKESDYFDTIGKLNLYDLAMIANDDEKGFVNYFDALPMAIIEINNGKFKLARSNRSYINFIKKRYGINLSKNKNALNDIINDGNSSIFTETLNRCYKTSGNRMFYDETLKDGSTVHSFIKKLCENPETKTTAIAFAALSITDPDQGASYANIARALASDYFNLFYVDLETDSFIEYSSDSNGTEPAVERQGQDFFAESRKEAYYYLHEDDAPRFVAAFTKENVIKELDEHGVFTQNYRLGINGEYVYVRMKAMRLVKGGRFIIIGVSSIDSRVKKNSADKLAAEVNREILQ